MYDLDEVDQATDATAADDVPDFMKPDDTWREDPGEGGGSAEGGAGDTEAGDTEAGDTEAGDAGADHGGDDEKD